MALKRRFYYENVFGVDQYSMKVLRALHAKYTRDYLSFFKSLSSMYGASPQKREIDEVVMLVQKARGTIESILQSQSIDRDDARVLYDLTGQIEEKKDALMEQAAQVKALRDRLDKVQREVGISSKDLNITRQIVRKSVKQASGSQREGVMDFLARTAPGTLELGRRLTRGVTAAFAGPFAPILGAGYDVARGAAGVAGGIRKKLQDRQERRFTSRLKAYGPGAGEDLERGSRVRGMGASLTGITGMAAREAGRMMDVVDGSGKGHTMDLMSFWSKGAYRAKYTKELLNVLKDIRGKRKGREANLKDRLLDTADDFALLGTAMAPLLVKGGGIALLAVGVGNAAVQFGKLYDAVDDWLGAKKDEKKALKIAEKSYSNWMRVIEEQGIEKIAEQAHMSVLKFSEGLAKQRQEIEMLRRSTRSGVGGFLVNMKEAVLGPDVGPSLVERREEIIRAGGADPSRYTIERTVKDQIDVMKKLTDGMNALSEAMEKRERDYGTVGSSNSMGEVPRDAFDAGDDVLLQMQSNGKWKVTED